MKKSVEKVVLGEFECETGVLRVSDPCYSTDVWCSGQVENAKKGTWGAVTFLSDEGRWGMRNARLLAYHRDSVHSDNPAEHFTAEECDFEVGVDSGQAGIFDLAHYKDDSVFNGNTPVHNYGDTVWYGFCCDATFDKAGAGVIPFGCVSSSGYGDGGYTATKYLNEAGEVVAINIEFIETEFKCCECGDENITEEEYYDNNGRCAKCLAELKNNKK